MLNSDAYDINEPVDAVVMWVDGSDPAFVASRAEHLRAVDPEAVHDGVGRHRDNGELRYMLRGMEANLPWIRRVFVVTNGQIPDFVDFSSPKVELVTHREIFPDTDLLPNFNTFAIESCLHLIPGLSERFVRFSDDFFVCTPVAKEEMLGSDGLGVMWLGSRVLLPGRASLRYDRQLARNAERVFNEYGYYPRHNYLHTPQVRLRSLCQQLIERWQDEYAETRHHRFRQEDDCNTLFLYPYFLLPEKRQAKIDTRTGRVEHPDVNYPRSSTYRQVQVGSRKTEWRRSLREIVDRPPTFLNLNDAFGNDPEEGDLVLYDQFLAALFADRTSFERVESKDRG